MWFDSGVDANSEREREPSERARARKILWMPAAGVAGKEGVPGRC